jgi:hypothetical protein
LHSGEQQIAFHMEEKRLGLMIVGSRTSSGGCGSLIVDPLQRIDRRRSPAEVRRQSEILTELDKWGEIDWQKGQINIRRGWSKGKETAGKNEGGMTQIATHPALSPALLAWRRESRYSHDSDWVFASNKAKGEAPRTAGVTGRDYLRPAAAKAGVIPADYRGRFGWHNLRHWVGGGF